MDTWIFDRVLFPELTSGVVYRQLAPTFAMYLASFTLPVTVIEPVVWSAKVDAPHYYKATKLTSNHFLCHKK